MAVYTFQNKNLSVSVNSHGAELCSIKNTLQEELIWQANKSIWARYAPVLFPIVGKLKDNKYSYNNKLYSLPQHGFARDKEFTVTEQSENVLEFELTATAETLEIYPFHFSLIIRYELDENNLKISYKVFNPDNKNLLFSIGAHPGFSCSSLKDYCLEFENNNDLVAEKLNNGLLTGETYKIKLGNKTLLLNSKLFDNDALVFKNSQINSVKLLSKKSAVKITLDCKGWPYFGIWTKKGCEDFICLEPWYGIADNENALGGLENKEGIVKLSPRQTFSAEYSIEVT